MEPIKQQRLESVGWKVGNVALFLDLNDEESAVVESKLRQRRKLSERHQLRTQGSVNLANRSDSSVNK